MGHAAAVFYFCHILLKKKRLIVLETLEAGTVFADGPPYSWKLNDAMMMRLMRGQVLKIQILASEKLCGLIALNLKF